MLYKITLLSLIYLLLTAPLVFSQKDDIASANHHYKLGCKFYRDGQTEKAIEELYKALSIEEVDFKAQLLLSHSLLKVKRYPEAAASLKGILPPHRGKPEIQKLLSKTYYEMHKLGEARNILAHAIAETLRPDYELHYLLSLVELRKGDTESAIREAKTVLRLNSGFAPAQKVLSDAYVMIGDYRQAETTLTRYLKKIPKNTEAEEMKERLSGIKILANSKPEESVREKLTRPVVRRIPRTVKTEEARRYRVKGSVKVQALFGKEGKVEHVFVVRSLGFGLDEEAMRVARGIEFTPGKVDDRPVSMWIGVEIVFDVIKIDVEREERKKSTLVLLNAKETVGDISHYHF